MERASLLGLPTAEQGRVLGVCEVLLGLLYHVHGLEVEGLPGLLVFLHELGGLNRVGPHANGLRSGNQHGHARGAVVRGVLGRAPDEAARLGAVTQGVGTPGDHGVAHQQVHVPDGQAAVGDGAVGQLVEVDLLIQVLTGGHDLDGTLGTLGAEAVAEVIGGVLLSAGQRAGQQGDAAEERGENQTEVADVTGRNVAHLVTDDEAQGLRVTGLTADFEQIGVDADKAAEAVTRCEGVDGAVTADNVRVGYAAQAGCLGGLGEHLVRLGELGRGDAHAGHTLLGVEEGTNDEEHERAQNQHGHGLHDDVLHAACHAATCAAGVVARTGREEPLAHAAKQRNDRHEQHDVAGRGDRVGGDQPRDFGGVTQRVQHLRRQYGLVGEEPGFRKGAHRLLTLIFGQPTRGEVLRKGRALRGGAPLGAGLGVELPAGLVVFRRLSHISSTSYRVLSDSTLSGLGTLG